MDGRISLEISLIGHQTIEVSTLVKALRVLLEWMEHALIIVTKIFKGDVKMKNNKGFTLIELIMVTIILGILAAVAAPRMLGTVQSAEEAAEVGVITALRAAVESYAEDKHITDGRYQYLSLIHI